ncbi:MAG: HemK2/MTQ2 family protein methyltransferase [Nanoarchaeota archaeon]
MVYEPREDSCLLEKAVLKYAFGDVLDMGTGTGILAKATAGKKEVRTVFAVDIDTQAVALLKKEKLDKIIVFESDLFSGIPKTRKFDCIIFNPPYLPEYPKDRDIALDGGKKGYELILRFLAEAKQFLQEDGIILLLFSTLSKKKVIERALMENRYAYEKVGEEKLDFETLYVYKISKI